MLGCGDFAVWDVHQVSAALIGAELRREQPQADQIVLRSGKSVTPLWHIAQLSNLPIGSFGFSASTYFPTNIRWIIRAVLADHVP